jgi:hypothetical protein
VKDKSRRLTDSKTPKFVGTNWESWKVATEIHLDACGILHYLEADTFPTGQGLDAQYHREADGMLRSYFASRVTDDIIIMLQGCHTAMSMWSRLHKKYGNITEGAIDKLYKEWTDLEQGDSQTITDFMTQIEVLHAKLDSVGKNLSDKDMRKKLVAGLGDAWWNIKQVLDLSYNDLSYEEAGNRLLQVEAKMKPRKGGRMPFELHHTEHGRVKGQADLHAPKAGYGRLGVVTHPQVVPEWDRHYPQEANATDWTDLCGRCGRPGHALSACQREGKFDSNGQELRQCFSCTSTDHESRNCPQKRGFRRMGSPGSYPGRFPPAHNAWETDKRPQFGYRQRQPYVPVPQPPPEGLLGEGPTEST